MEGAMDILMLLLWFAAGAVLGYFLYLKSVMAIWRAFVKLNYITDRYANESLELLIDNTRLRKKYEGMVIEPLSEQQRQSLQTLSFDLDKAYEKLKKKISEGDQDLHDLPSDVSGPDRAALDRLPKIGNHKVHAPRVFTLKITLKSIKRLWNDLLK